MVSKIVISAIIIADGATIIEMDGITTTTIIALVVDTPGTFDHVQEVIQDHHAVHMNVVMMMKFISHHHHQKLVQVLMPTIQFQTECDRLKFHKIPLNK